jgi:hypothetical protein
MADYNLNNATTTEISVPDFIVASKVLDAASPNQEESYWYFSDATKNMGYYSEIPEINSAANALTTWAFGNGYDTDDVRMKVILDHVVGMGKDTFTKIIYNHEVMKLVVGDAFIEVKRSDDGTIINMIPISPERVRVVFNKAGLIKRYDTYNGSKWTEIKKENMIHSQNKRIGDQLHGTSQIDACKWIIDARNEALITNRMIEKRGRALGVYYYKTNNEGKILAAGVAIQKANKEGQMLMLPEGTGKIEDFPTKPLSERMDWIRYLETFFYQVFGVPRSIATSDGTSEVGGKMGNVNFEPTYAKEKNDMEEDLWQQQQIKVSFIKQQSLGGLVQEDQTKNSGMTSIQPNDVQATMTRE